MHKGSETVTCPISLAEKLLCRGEGATIFRHETGSERTQKAVAKAAQEPKLARVDLNLPPQAVTAKGAVNDLGVSGSGMKAKKKKHT